MLAPRRTQDAASVTSKTEFDATIPPLEELWRRRLDRFYYDHCARFRANDLQHESVGIDGRRFVRGRLKS